jgi:transcription termination factor NusB
MKMKKDQEHCEMVLVRIWDNMEDLHTQLTSGLAGEFTLKELEKIDKAIAGVLKMTTARLNEICSMTNRAP